MNFYIIGLFEKLTKTPFGVKASYINMEDLIEMRPKWLFRVHPKISKKSQKTSLGLKLEEICLVKVDHFCQMAKSQMCSKMHFFAKWAQPFKLALCFQHDP